MSKITNDGLTQSSTGCFMYPYRNSVLQMVKPAWALKLANDHDIIISMNDGICESLADWTSTRSDSGNSWHQL